MDICASAVLSLLLEDFLASLTESQYAKLIEIYESNNPDNHINDDVAIKLIGWFKMKKEELSLQCRTAAFWLKYTEYVQIVQQLIKAEGTNNWTLHVSFQSKCYICSQRPQITTTLKAAVFMRSQQKL